MERSEIEKKIAEKLWEIRDLVFGCNPESPILNIAVDYDYVNCFSMKDRDYILNVTQWDKKWKGAENNG